MFFFVLQLLAWHKSPVTRFGFLAVGIPTHLWKYLFKHAWKQWMTFEINSLSGPPLNSFEIHCAALGAFKHPSDFCSSHVTPNQLLTKPFRAAHVGFQRHLKVLGFSDWFQCVHRYVYTVWYIYIHMYIHIYICIYIYMYIYIFTNISFLVWLASSSIARLRNPKANKNMFKTNLCNA